MAIATHGELPYSIESAKVYPYAGGVPGVAKDIPGIFSVEMAASIETQETRGSNRILASSATFNSLDLTITAHQLNFDAVAVLSGGMVTTTGVAPNQIRTLQRKSSDVVADYQVKAQTASKTVDGGAFRFVFPRCQWQDGPSFGLADNEFAEVEIGAKAIPTATDNMLYQWEAFETAVPIT